MAAEFAQVIIDISQESLDRVFTYRIPPRWSEKCLLGSVVDIPFGRANRVIRGYVIGFLTKADCETERIKEILSVKKTGEAAEEQLLALAVWMREEYGATMIQALRTVLPVRRCVRAVVKKSVECLLSPDELASYIERCQKKKHRARLRLAEAFLTDRSIPDELLRHKLNLSPATITAMEEEGVLYIRRETLYRNPVQGWEQKTESLRLNPEQQAVLDAISARQQAGKRGVTLLHGVTGSGKTEVYMEAIACTLKEGKQAIVLIPEIALTYQTVMRFYRRFGDRISVINSRLSEGERYDQFERAKKGELDIVIGPRSALFTPFPRLGLIVVDEEHDQAYQSEQAPRYHAREVAVKRAQLAGADVILGSATPSMEAYTRARLGQYQLLEMKKRARAGSELPRVYVADLRKEMAEGNKSIFSRLLQEKMADCLARREQILLFINRRGYSGFVSCRSCGQAISCPHCDVTLKYHNDAMLRCHYCGYQKRLPARCPSCTSPYIAPFGTGTQKVEKLAQLLFPDVRILRMDADTTREKGGHERILSAFAAEEADILIGTQMIVKGHDFPKVTLVGAVAADLSLSTPDFRGAERTFQLLTQAAGRAGRAGRAGEVVIQTYRPQHYSITEAVQQNYEGFYEQELLYRDTLHYPPSCGMLTVQVASPDEEEAERAAHLLAECARRDVTLEVLGPADAPLRRLNDIFYKRVYVKATSQVQLMACREGWEELPLLREKRRELQIQFDLDVGC